MTNARSSNSSSSKSYSLPELRTKFLTFLQERNDLLLETEKTIKTELDELRTQQHKLITKLELEFESESESEAGSTRLPLPLPLPKSTREPMPSLK